MEITSNTTPPVHSSTLEEKFKHLKFPKFHHEKHKPIVNINEVADNQLTVGAKIADAVAADIRYYRDIPKKPRIASVGEEYFHQEVSTC